MAQNRDRDSLTWKVKHFQELTLLMEKVETENCALEDILIFLGAMDALQDSLDIINKAMEKLILTDAMAKEHKA